MQKFLLYGWSLEDGGGQEMVVILIGYGMQILLDYYKDFIFSSKEFRILQERKEIINMKILVDLYLLFWEWYINRGEMIGGWISRDNLYFINFVKLEENEIFLLYRKYVIYFFFIWFSIFKLFYYICNLFFGFFDFVLQDESVCREYFWVFFLSNYDFNNNGINFFFVYKN